MRLSCNCCWVAGAGALILQRLYDIELVLLDVHFSLYELHTHLLNRMKIKYTSDMKLVQKSKHSLTLANDQINSFGDGYIVIEDSATLFFQVDRPGTPGFEFSELINPVAYALDRSLRDISNSRDAARKAYCATNYFEAYSNAHCEAYSNAHYEAYCTTYCCSSDGFFISYQCHCNCP